MEFHLENPLTDTFISLFENESQHMPPNTYSQILRAMDFNSSVRREIISLISQLCHKFDSFLSYLSINYLDRYLSIRSIPEEKPWILRLVAVSCVSLALKMRKTESSVSDIQNDCGFIFDSQTIQRMELLILGALKWRMRSITPFSFINFFTSLFKFKDPPLKQALKARATEIIFKAQNELKLLEFRPSIISASALLSASHELFPLQFISFKESILNCSHVNKEKLIECYNEMQAIAMEGYVSVLDTVSCTASPATVLDGRWSSGDGDPSADSGSENLGVERGVKRRKMSHKMFQLSEIQRY
ncbi:hypothetical protein LguiA_022622 [Lonicera macranthoides]